MGAIAETAPDDPGPMPFEIDAGELGAGSSGGGGTAGRTRGKGGGIGPGVLPPYLVVSMDLMGLEALWNIALEVSGRELMLGLGLGLGVGLRLGVG